MDTNRDCGCASAFGRLEALVDGHLDSVECAEVRKHCETCESCASELEIVDKLTQKFKAACTEEPPLSLRDAILAELNKKA